MKHAKLWSVLCAAVLLCACIAGVLFTGTSASDTRIPTATVTYVVGTDGASIRACLDKAAGETWGKDDVLEIQFSGEDASAYTAPDAENGISGYTLFETATIFREDDTQLPIVIRGTDEDRAATIVTPANSYNATNDYFFTDLTMNGGASASTYVSFYAGSGELVFENTKHNNYSYTYYYGDCQVTDAWEGWDAAKIAANADEDGLVETGIVFGNGTKFYTDFTSDAPDERQRMSAVGYNGDEKTNPANPVISALRRPADEVTAALTEDEVEAVKEAAKTATYRKGNVVALEDCLLKPWDTSAYLVLDSGTADPTSYEFGYCSARKGVSPVQKAKLEAISGGYQYLTADNHVKTENEVYVGDTAVIMRGGKTLSYEVGIRLTNHAMLVGDLTLEIHEDDPAVPTHTRFVQPGQTGATSTVFGNYYFLMTGGTIGDGVSIAKVDSDGDQVVSGTDKQWVYNDSNDGYWGAPVATGTVVNEVRGGQIWIFYGSRYANSYKNTPVSIVLPGTGETLNAMVSVHNKISGGIIGGPEVTGDRTDSAGNYIDVQNGNTAFHGGARAGSTKVEAICNEISGGTIYQFTTAGASNSKTYGPNDLYNFVYGTKENYPTFRCDFRGCTSKGGYNVTNVIKGYPVFNDGTTNRCIIGGPKSGTTAKITNYYGGMPTYKHIFGGVTGGGAASSSNAAVQYLYNHFDFDEDVKTVGEIWAGNGYWQVSGQDGATESKGNSSNYVTYELVTNVYGGNYGTFRAESCAGTDAKSGTDTVLNVYDGIFSGSFMPVNRTYSRTTTTIENKTHTTNIYGGTFATASKAYVYMGGQNSRNQNIVNNIYGGTFGGTFYGGGDAWVKNVTNNVYGGTFKASYYGGGYKCGSETVTNNIYGGTFSASREHMGAYGIASSTANQNAGDITNNIYGGDFGDGWTYMGHLNGPADTITNHFYSGADNPCRDSENELYKYYNAATMLESGVKLHDQVVCGTGYNETSVSTNTANTILNTFEGGAWTTADGAGANITIHGGMRWGVAGDVTNNFVKGDYYRFFGGCDYGRVTGTITNNFGKALAEGEEAPVLTFSNYVMGGGLDQTDTPAAADNTGYQRIPLNEKIKIALAVPEADRTGRALQWAKIAETYGEDFEGGAEYIVNNVYFGSFHQFVGGAYGCQESTYYSKSKINTITNNIFGGTFDQRDGESSVYNGGCYRNAEIETGIFNNINGGTYNGNWYGGTIGKGTATCPLVTNTINAFEGNKTENAFVYFGNGQRAEGLAVKTVINDFDAGKTYVCGGSNNFHTAPEGAEYGIDTTINGGTFCGVWGIGGGGSATYTGNVRTTVNGGTFNGYAVNMPNSIAGGPRNATAIGNIELIINDGIFDAHVVGGTIYGSYADCDKVIDGNIALTVKGGEFRQGIYGVHKADSEEITCTGTVAINVEQTAGVALKILGDATVDSFTANGEAVEIGAKTDLEIKALTGALIAKQTEGWAAQDYLKLPVASQYTVINEAKYGSYTEDDTILVKGVAVIPVGATLRLAERVGVRIVLNKEDVEAYGDAFTYSVTLGEKALAEGGIEEIRANNYSILFDGIGLAKFGEKFTVESPLLETMEYSIADLAVMAQTAWAENAKWKAYADALIEFHNVYNLNAENTLTPEAVELAPKGEKGEADGVVSANVTLLMADAAGIRLNVELDAAPENAKILINGNEIVSDLIKVEGNVLTADLYFAHEYLAETFVLTLESEAGVHLTYTASIEALANQLAADDANENKDNATAFLVYIQKAVACK